ncbi:hypothetical protein P0Y67_20895 [Photobacterium sp. SP02]
MSRLSSVFSQHRWMRASYSLLAQKVTRNAFVSLVLFGAVVGAPGADNLKIRP